MLYVICMLYEYNYIDIYIYIHISTYIYICIYVYKILHDLDESFMAPLKVWYIMFTREICLLL